MVIEVRLYDVLRRYAPSSSSGIITVDVEDNIDVKALLNEMEVNLQEIGTVLVNGVNTGVQEILSDGDRVGLWPPGHSG